MARVITNPSKQDQRAIIQLLSVERCKPVEIHKWLLSMDKIAYQRQLLRFGHKCSKATVRNDALAASRSGAPSCYRYTNCGYWYCLGC